MSIGCKACSTEFAPAHGLQKYCSLSCRKAEARRRVPQRWRHLSSRYGLKPDAFSVMLAQQDGRCPICATELVGTGAERNAPNVDHDHTTGKLRAILCRPCNIALGHLKEDPDIFRAAAEYLTSWKAAHASRSV